MISGKTRRLGRIFRPNGKTVIVAMDHGGFFGAQPGFEQPGELIRQVIAGGADAILATLGLAEKFATELAPAGLILRVDGGVSRLGTREWRGGLLHEVETVLQAGADGVIAMGFPGAKHEDQNLQYLAKLSGQCTRAGIPVAAEMLPRGFEGGEDARTPESLTMAARLGAELGADIIKTQYTGSVETFRKVVSGCYVPVVVLGGAKMENDRAVLQTVREAMDAGAAGVAMGRNIWGHASPRKMTAAIVAVVHDGASVDDALGLLE